jgi:iron complex transport system ATP-binding protein
VAAAAGDVTALLEARDVRVAIRGVEILRGADLELHPGELVALVGPNGAGKSTLARAISGLQPLAGGHVAWEGVALGRIRNRRLAQLRAFVPQRPRVPDGITVREAVSVGRAPHIRPLQRPSRADRDAVERAMARAGVTEFAARALTTLSGGELQRVQIAVALAQEAPVLIADEPASHLDLGAAAGLARMLRGLVADGLGVLLVVHDLGLAAAVADRVVVMAGGRTVAAGAAEDVLGAALLADVWQVDAALERGDDGRLGLRVDWLAEAAGRTSTAH